ncbi:MAG: 23S rRNA (adenine(2503)-C(2))-methyltransferase RlmN [Phycisphaerales bacterium]
MKHPSRHVFEETPDTLAAWLKAERGLPRFRADQILEWVYKRGVTDPQAMTNLSKRDREWLAGNLVFGSSDQVSDQTATDGTRKLLVRWRDYGERGALRDHPLPVVDTPAPERETECVMIPTDDRKTACISSQVGCPVGCRFCASGLGGLDGNLSAGRIVEQVWLLNRELQARDRRITNVVFMGMGEPLANYAAVVKSIRTLMSPWSLHISARKITVSTVGLPQAIRRFADEELPVTLALSLHAPNDTVRRELIPWAEYATVRELLDACREYFDRTGREVTLEYTLMKGVNDRPEHAEELARIARTIRANVNLIRYNEVAGLPYRRPADDDVRAFQRTLREKRINTHIRASRGRDIAAACGQLRHERSVQSAP